MFFFFKHDESRGSRVVAAIIAVIAKMKSERPPQEAIVVDWDGDPDPYGFTNGWKMFFFFDTATVAALRAELDALLDRLEALVFDFDAFDKLPP